MSEAAAAAVEPDETPDVETIVPASGKIVVNGVQCTVRRLKTREFLALMNVLTSGLGGALSDVTVDLSDEEGVARDLSALMIMAVPRATDEFVFFLRQIVDPVDERQKGAVASYLMENPDIDVMLDIFEIVATQEKDDLASLMGKAQAMWKRVAPLYGSKSQTQ